MKNIMITLLFLISLNADTTTSGVTFTDYEEIGALYFANYADKQDLKNIGYSNTDATNVLNQRAIQLYTSIIELDNTSGIGKVDLQRIRTKAHNLTNYEYVLVSVMALALNLLFFGTATIILARKMR